MTRTPINVPIRRKPDPSGPFGPASPVRTVDPASTRIPTAKAPRLRIGEHVLDAWDDLWRVDDARTTEHDFAIYLGRPKEASGPMGAAVIITSDLAEYFERHRRTPTQMSLPIGASVIKRIRAVLGHHRYQDAEMFWLERVADLESLTIADFCARHGVSAGAVSQARRELSVGTRLRSANWWREPEMAALLDSKRPTAWLAMHLGLSAVTVRTYRSRVRG